MVDNTNISKQAYFPIKIKRSAATSANYWKYDYLLHLSLIYPDHCSIDYRDPSHGYYKWRWSIYIPIFQNILLRV